MIIFHCESKLSTLSARTLSAFNLHFKRFLKLFIMVPLNCLYVSMYCTHVCTYMVSVLEGTIKKVWDFKATLYRMFRSSHFWFLFFGHIWRPMIYPLDSRNTKKPKTKTADFFVSTRIFVKLFQKKPN